MKLIEPAPFKPEVSRDKLVDIFKAMHQAISIGDKVQNSSCGQFSNYTTTDNTNECQKAYPLCAVKEEEIIFYLNQLNVNDF